MSLQRLNCFLADEPTARGASLDELLGQPTLRPGELHEAFGLPLPPAFRTETVAARAPIALAVAVVVERELVLEESLSNTGTAVTDMLDEQAKEAIVRSGGSAAACSYVRVLLAVLQRHGVHGVEVATDAPVVVPVRIGDRLRATGYRPRLRAGDIVPALRWELAAILAGQTLTEWALTELLRVRA